MSQYPQPQRKPSSLFKFNSCDTTPNNQNSHIISPGSLDLSLEKYAHSLSKELSSQLELNMPSFKKLGHQIGALQDKPLWNPYMTNQLVEAKLKSPKGYFSFLKQGKSQNSSINASLQALISPKNLVKKAMSKAHSKERKKEKQNKSLNTSMKKNLNKPFSLRVNACGDHYGSGNEASQTIPTMAEENSPTTPLNGKKTKFKRLKKNVDADFGLARLSPQSTTSEDNFFPQTRCKSQAKLGSASLAVSQKNSRSPSRSPSGVFASLNEVEKVKTKKPKLIEKADDHSTSKKIGPCEQIDLFSKEKKMVEKVFPQQPHINILDENKTFEGKNSPTTAEVNKNTSPLGQALAHLIPERPSSPGLISEDVCYSTVIDEASFHTEETGKDSGVLSLSNRDKKKISNDLAKTIKADLQQKKKDQMTLQKLTSEPDERTKHIQSNMLEKLRDLLGGTEWLCKEDFAYLLHENKRLEDELYQTREENQQLRDILVQMQNSPPWGSDGNQELIEIIARQQNELEIYKKREKAVGQIFKLIKKTEVDINELFTPEGMEQELSEHIIDFSQEEHFNNEKLLNLYAMNTEGKEKYISSQLQYQNHLTTESKEEYVSPDLVLQTEASQEPSSHFGNDISQITIEDKKDLLIKIQAVQNKKNSKMNEFENHIMETKNSGDSSPLFSTNQSSAHAFIKSKPVGKLNLDLAKIGVQKFDISSSQESAHQNVNLPEALLMKTDLSTSWPSQSLVKQKVQKQPQNPQEQSPSI